MLQQAGFFWVLHLKYIIVKPPFCGHTGLLLYNPAHFRHAATLFLGKL